MRLIVSEAVPPSWEDLMKRCEATLYHSPHWLAASGRGSSMPRYFIWQDADSKPLAIAAGALFRSRVPLLRRWGATLLLDSMPAVVPERRTDGTVMLEMLKAYALDAGCRTLTIESHMAQPLPVDAGVLAASARERIEFRLNLEPSEERLWEGLQGHHRRKIKKAMKQHLTIRESRHIDDARALRELQRGSQDRRRKRGEHMGLGDDEPIVTLIGNMLGSGIGRLFVAEHERRIVSGAFMSAFNGRAYYVFGGSNADGFRLDAPGVLFWHMIGKFRSEGYLELNLGGVPATGADSAAPEHGLYRFKSGFGGREVPCADYAFDLRPRLSAALQLATRIIRSANR